jgi:hypothetical protein
MSSNAVRDLSSRQQQNPSRGTLIEIINDLEATFNKDGIFLPDGVLDVPEDTNGELLDLIHEMELTLASDGIPLPPSVTLVPGP